MEPIVTTKLFTRNFNSLLFGLVFTLGPAVLFGFAYKGSGEMGYLAFGVIFAALAAFIIYSMITKTRIFEIYTDKILVFNMWKSQIDELPFSRIHSWSENEESKYSTLAIFAGPYKIIMDSDFTGEELYSQIKEIISKACPENKREEIKYAVSKQKGFIIIFIVVLSILIFSMLKTWYSGMNDLKTGKFKSKPFMITRAPEIIHHKSDNTLNLYVADPDDKFTFEFEGSENPDSLIDGYIFHQEDYLLEDDSAMTALKNDSLDTTNYPPPPPKGEKTISIEDDSYKATDTKQLIDSMDSGEVIFLNTVSPVHKGKLETFFGNDEVYTCGITYDEDEKYLTFNQFAKERHKSNLRTMWILAAISLGVGFIIYLLFRSIKKEKATIETLPDLSDPDYQG